MYSNNKVSLIPRYKYLRTVQHVHMTVVITFEQMMPTIVSLFVKLFRM